MKIRLLLLGLSTAVLSAGTTEIKVWDDERRPVAAAAVTATFSQVDTPLLASMRTYEGRTGNDGVWRLDVADDRCLIRLRVSKPRHFEADADHRHGLGTVPTKPAYAIVLPRLTVGIPLAYKEVQLPAGNKTLPSKTWLGFDFAMGDLVAPWGAGLVSDVQIWNDGEQVGWTESAETLALLRKEPEAARMDEARFAAMYGAFRGTTKLRFTNPGDGVQRTPEFWPYAQLKMPAEAPASDYAALLEMDYHTLPPADEAADHTGYFLRLRTRQDTAGKIISAQYAKIHGRIASGYGWITFRYYYNPTPNDRRLVFDLEHNLLKPPSGTTGTELDRYRTSER
jgi:hypothetical protein